MELPTFKFALMEGLGSEFLPTRAHSTDTGWDVRSRSSFCLRAGQYAKIPLGFRMFAPPGWWLELRPRSSSFAKKHLNSLYGVIDEGYENELILACDYLPDINAMGKDLRIEPGEAIGQIIPVRREEMKVEMISNEEYEALCQARKTSRGKGGFGSTGI
jgi:dUTP pyrophosphatase